jgi:hypothetical protein
MNGFPTPALILTLNRSMASAIAEVERIFLDSDPRRTATTRFLVLNLRERNEAVELSHVGAAQPKRDHSALSWKQALERVRKQAGVLKAGLTSALHELRAHEKLIEAGLGDQSALPLDVILVADLAEVEAAALISLLPMLQSLVANEPLARIHLLLATAVFDDAPLAEARMFFGLDQLKEMLEGGNNSKEAAAPIPNVYLFDRYKEGVWEARDAAELQIILGNFLLALLSGGLAQRLAHSVHPLDAVENDAWFSSAAAAILFFDTGRVKQACIARFAAEIVKSEFHSKITPDPGPVEEMAAWFIENKANAQAWLAELCRETKFHPSALGLDFQIPDLNFENLPMQDWADTIQAYNREFHEKQLPAQTDLLYHNAEALDGRFREQLNTFTALLPQLPRLYPGGVSSARQVLERIRRVLLEGKAASAEPGFVEKEWEARLEQSLGRLQAALGRLPKPPRWFFRLPAFLKKPAIQLFQLIYLRRELQTLLDLRQASLRLVEQKYIAWMEQAIQQELAKLCKDWVEILDAKLKAMARLQSALDGLGRRFTRQSNDAGTQSSTFRLSVMDESVLAWAMYYGKRPQEGFRHSLLADREFLKDWQKAKPAALAARLENFCREVYQPLSGVGLQDAIQHRAQKDADSLAATLIQGAVPLLRPNFDRRGGGYSFQLRFFQSREPRSSSLYPYMRNDPQEWQEIDTGDACVAICCRVRSLIPAHALEGLFARGRAAFESLDEDAKAEFVLEAEV